LPTHVTIEILSITSDNASNNDTMIAELADLIDEFPGPANQTRCFAHIINLVVKSIMHQFELKDDKGITDLTKEMLSLAGNIQLEEGEMTREGDADTEDTNEYDNVEGWIDERTLMEEDELAELEERVKPVRAVLTKV
jgi:hypothetical protein